MARESFKAGDVIVWRHYPEAGEPFERIGTVWSGAPVGEGLSNAWWVHADEPEKFEEPGVPVAVGRASRTRSWRKVEPDKGEIYGSSRWDLQAGALTSAAARWHRERLTLAA